MSVIYIVNRVKLLIIMLFCITMLLGCEITEDGAIRGQKGQILLVTEAEIKEAQKFLLTANYPVDMPKTAEGGVVFDGVVTSVKQITETGLYIAEFKILNILFGKLNNEVQIIIHSPKVEKGGVDFKVGNTYRVFTVFIDGFYRTWSSTGTTVLP